MIFGKKDLEKHSHPLFYPFSRIFLDRTKQRKISISTNDCKPPSRLRLACKTQVRERGQMVPKDRGRKRGGVEQRRTKRHQRRTEIGGITSAWQAGAHSPDYSRCTGAKSRCWFNRLAGYDEKCNLNYPRFLPATAFF